MKSLMKMELPKGLQPLKQRKQTGAHYTPTVLAEFVAGRIVKAWDGKKSNEPVVLLDPAIGDGQLLLSLASKMKQEAMLRLVGFDTDEYAIRSAEQRIRQQLEGISLSFWQENFLDFVIRIRNDCLFKSASFGQCDLVIANPPYVRTQILGAKAARRLAQMFSLKGRVDLSYAFLDAISQVLKPGGIAGIIVSNRFMTTEAGASVRQNLLANFDILHIWDLGDTQLFEAAVLPAVILAQRKLKPGPRVHSSPRFTSIYKSNESITNLRCVLNVLDGLDRGGRFMTSDGQSFKVTDGNLNVGQTPSDVWRLSTPSSDQWLRSVEEHTFTVFGQVGKVRVGVKTTADSVFIREDWSQLPKETQPEVLRPVITHHIGQRFRGQTPVKKILYTHTISDGQRRPIDLRLFPRAEKYLNQYRSILEGRGYVAETGRKWFEIWVPQDPAAWTYPKVVFRDITEQATFWIDLDGSVVNGDCYWWLVERGDQDMIWLALAVGNSSFIEAFYDRKFNNKLYSGRRRFMSQYVEKFPLPDPNLSASKTIIRLARERYEAIHEEDKLLLEKELDTLICQAFGVSQLHSPCTLRRLSKRRAQT